MMIAVFPDIVKVVMLSAGADTLLGIHSTLQACEVRAWICSAQENWLELVHARIGEQQGGVIVRDDR